MIEENCNDLKSRLHKTEKGCAFNELELAETLTENNEKRKQLDELQKADVLLQRSSLAHLAHNKSPPHESSGLFVVKIF